MQTPREQAIESLTYECERLQSLLLMMSNADVNEGFQLMEVSEIGGISNNIIVLAKYTSKEWEKGFSSD